jgi:hypothetical protein
MTMDLSRGFQIEDPDVFVPWGIGEDEVWTLLPGIVRLVTTGYLAAKVRSLNGMEHNLGFHFTPREAGSLHELEFFRFGQSDIAASFAEWQAHLERTFGAPTAQSPGDEGLPNCTWQIGAAQVRHLVFDRFGPEEHVRIVRN